jgi:hypothetical protein
VKTFLAFVGVQNRQEREYFAQQRHHLGPGCMISKREENKQHQIRLSFSFAFNIRKSSPAGNWKVAVTVESQGKRKMMIL